MSFMCLDCEIPYLLCIHEWDELGGQPVNMIAAGEAINKIITENCPNVNRQVQQVLNVAEEAGEFVGAFRRHNGMATRRGSSQEDVEDELADVIIAAYVAGAALEIDIESAIRRKLKIIFQRGWTNE
jgi:NTP pyrophosphatase (non-canonical NTP hydrolase)